MASTKLNSTAVKPATVVKPTSFRTIMSFSPASVPLDKYFVDKNSIWKDVIIHEKNMCKKWKQTWAHLMIQTSHSSKEKEGKKKDAMLANNNTQFVYFQSSRIIGSRLLESQLQKKECVQLGQKMPKIRLVQEQYGYYRKMKYLKEKIKVPPAEIPTSKQRHTVKPLLC